MSMPPMTLAEVAFAPPRPQPKPNMIAPVGAWPPISPPDCRNAGKTGGTQTHDECSRPSINDLRFR